MDENSLRCPQCGSPVLQTANYCVICGIRLPDPVQDQDEPAGWESARSSNDPIVPVPPIEIPEFDDPTDDESTIDIEAAGGVDETYDPIPDIELDDLDRFIADDRPSSSDSGNLATDAESAESDALLAESALNEAAPETGDPELESDEEAIEMIDEGAPAFDELTAPDPETHDESDAGDDLDEPESDHAEVSPGSGEDESDDVDGEDVEIIDAPADPEASDMIEEGGPVFDTPATPSRTVPETVEVDESDEAVDIELESDADSEFQLEVAGEPDRSDRDDERGDIHVESDEAAIEMIDEGGPAFDDETAPPDMASAGAHEATSAYDAGGSDDAETSSFQGEQPMISASYPQNAIEGNDSGAEPNAEHWWPEDNDDDWVYFEAERSGAMAVTSEAAETGDSPETGRESLERARALIQELGSLLPQLTTSVDEPSGVDLSDLRAQAIAARGERSFDDWAALRQAVGNAAGRPTDIETILQLSKRVDDIAALIVERDRLHDAFQHVIEWIDNANEG